MEFKELKEIGLTEGEIKVYEALLDLGESTKTKIAERSNVSPSKIYDVLHRLKEKGLVSMVKKQGIAHFSAANPELIRDYLQQKQEKIKHEQKLADQLIPTLLLKYQKTEQDADVEVFYGWKGMKTCFDDIVKTLEKGDTNYIFGASTGHDSQQADIFFQQYYPKKKNKGFATKIIFNENVRSNKTRTKPFLEKPNQMRFLHHDTFTEINLYKNTVLFIMLFKKPIIIRIKSKEAADSFRKFFETMWGLAKE